jgi:hypothetical protein
VDTGESKSLVWGFTTEFPPLLNRQLDCRGMLQSSAACRHRDVISPCTRCRTGRTHWVVSSAPT